MRPVVTSLAAAGAVALFANACRINKLLSRSSVDEASLNVTPATVRDSALLGAREPRRTRLLVSNSGQWAASNDSPWIELAPTSGNGQRMLTVELDPDGLRPGLHEGSVTVRDTDESADPITIPVTFVIQQPILSVDPDEISHTARSSNSAFHDTIRVRNRGTGPLVWTASRKAEWLTLGTVSGSGDGSIPIRMSAAGLGIGTYKDEITIVAVGAAGSPTKVTVTLRRRRGGGDDDDDDDDDTNHPED